MLDQMERCSTLKCVEPERHGDRCPGRRDCPNCDCCTVQVCEAKTWRAPGTPQHIVAVLDAQGFTCPCERRG